MSPNNLFPISFSGKVRVISKSGKIAIIIKEDSKLL